MALGRILTCLAVVTVLAGCAADPAATRPATTSPAPAGAPAAPPPLGAPEAPPGEAVLTTATGHGAAVGASALATDGSYTLYAVCEGGAELAVLSRRTESVTAVPCSGLVSRLQFLADAGTDDLSIRADPGQAWAITVTDSPEP